MVTDKEASTRLVGEALKLLFDSTRANKLSENITRMAKPHATVEIVNEIDKLLMEESLDSDLPSKEKNIYCWTKIHTIQRWMLMVCNL